MTDNTTIFFDNSATTRPAPEVIEAMKNALEVSWGNPSSLHSAGLDAEHIVRDSRTAVLEALGVKRGEGTLYFTSGGTEANNTAVFGSVYAKGGNSRHVISTGSEHPSIRQPLEKLEAQGVRVTRLSTKGGKLDLDELKAALSPDTRLVTLMLVNNETGALYDIKSAFDIVKRYDPKITTHCDATQAFMKVPFTPMSLGAELVTVSAHKIHGPKGIGALYVSKTVKTNKRLVPFMLGGEQEEGMRAGTENVPGIAGFGAAVKLPYDLKAVEAARELIVSSLPGRAAVNLPEKYVPHILSIRLPKIKSETMLHYLSSVGIFVSTGSACSSKSLKVSKALTEFGLAPEEADSTLRISLGDDTTPEMCRRFAEALEAGINRFAR